MFRAVRFDITARMRRGKNRLAVCFTPTSRAVIDREMPTWSIIADSIKETKRNFIRKAQIRLGMGLGSDLADGWHLGACFAANGNLGGVADGEVHHAGAFADA